MFTLVRAAALVGSLALAGCGTTSNGMPTVNDIVAGVQAACGFLPTATSVANLIVTHEASVQTGAQIIGLICSAVTKKSAIRGSGGPKVYGVAIKGKFVR